MFDAYALLGVRRFASEAEIIAAYRQLMKAGAHPDAAGADAEDAANRGIAAREINRAYATLRDPEQRARHDADLRLHGDADERQPGATRASSYTATRPASGEARPERPKPARRVRTTAEREEARAIRAAEEAERREAKRRAAARKAATKSGAAPRNDDNSDGRSTWEAASASDAAHDHRHGDRASLRGLFAYAMRDREGQRISNAIVAGTAALAVLFGAAGTSLLFLVVAGFLGAQIAVSRRWCHTPAADLWAAVKSAVRWLGDAWRDLRQPLNS